ncbi:Pentatricopeptide repeat-containing protein, chloroplastic [Vitis vinifera]|uniref:Pentatricopeptide repeat-containing protein, chloroplastic n=1 Tax=Vitis vinifera TaxID=29760 RepID=A0A438G0I0_VITVI|nr:Pentatricopeptide repeat-containing protein, chloroplastic [Vitis vinifera]
MASAHGFASSLMSPTELGFTLSSSFSIQRPRFIVPKFSRSFLGNIVQGQLQSATTKTLAGAGVFFARRKGFVCALEVFEWLRKENRVDKETMELMVSIMCSWVKKLIEGEHDVGDVVDLLVDMDCVGLKPGFSMIEKVISLYWEMEEKEKAVLFVKEVLRREIAYSEDDGDGHKGGPTGYLAWKMMAEGNYRGAVKLVIHLRESGLKPEVYSYLIAMTAVVKELNEFAKALRKLKGFTKSGLIAELDAENVELIEKYQSDLLADGVCLSNWVIQEGRSPLHGVVYERLLAMYICAGRDLRQKDNCGK